MKQPAKYKLIALFLLTVFSINTLAGFACSVGVDMGYNAKHHEHGSIAEEKEHEHGPAHHHEPIEKLASDKTLKGSSDDCCTGQVTRFSQLDKSVVQNNLLLKVPVFTIALLTNFFNWDIKASKFLVAPSFKYLRRSWVINDTDIRTAIQSFQI